MRLLTKYRLDVQSRPTKCSQLSGVRAWNRLAIGRYFFEQQLLDFDVASNWGNWAYIAGAGEGPARHFNVMKQALQYDKDAEFVSLLLPDINSTLTGPAKHRPYAIHGSTPWQESWAPYLP
ncbi:MAG: FAD-binding domain-containing protein [Rheinheimera sp.]|nr:FAD-binding domain-containing protein [Rheinheimera sp.]